MADKVVVGQDDRGYYLVWMLDEEDGEFQEGARIGEEGKPDPKDLESVHDQDARDVLLADIAAYNTKGRRCENFCFYWDSKKEANAALRVVKAALKNEQSDPARWPEWTRKALEAGWKPPKG
jgi:hypothetical protein